MKYFFTLIAFFVLISDGFAQYNSKSKKAIKAFEKGQTYYRSRQFKEAEKEWRKAVSIDNNFLDAHIQLSKVYNLVFFDEQKWLYHTQKAIEIAPESKLLTGVYFDYGKYLFERAKYEEANQYLSKSLALKPSLKSIADECQKLKTESEFAIEAIKKPLTFNPIKMSENVNFAYGNYFPTMTADNRILVFTALNVINKIRNEDLMQSLKGAMGWEKAQPFDEKINTEHQEGASTISGDGRTLVFTRCGDPLGLGSCDLYICYKTGNKWSEPKNMGHPINSKTWDSQPSLSADGRTLYFASERGGGYGQSDIWITYKKDDNTWTEPINAGPKINSHDREGAPFLHANNRTLYFSSTGHYDKNFGGFDLFKYDYIEDGEIQNLGWPLNTQQHETTLFITADSKKGYLSKDEKGDLGTPRTLLYEFDVPAAIAPAAKTYYAKGYIYNSKDNKKLAATIETYDLKTNKLLQKTTSDSENGEYLITLNENGEFALYISKEGFLHESVYFDFTNNNIGVKELNVGLKPLEKGESIVLTNIFFESGSYKLDEKSKTELDAIVKIFENNPQLKVEISGHTDDVGGDKENLTLSNNRAVAVKNYLVTQGIKDTQIVAKGYGETKPMLENSNEENRAKNRRIEFKIL